MEMVGMMGRGGLREQAVSLLNDAKLQTDISAKTDLLKRLKEILVHRDPSLLREFVPYLMELQTERASPIRKCLAELIEEIGTNHLQHVPVMVPVLLALLQDDTPAVARSAITSGTNLFRNTLEQVAIQGIQTGHVERWLEDSWMSMIRLKDAIYSCAYQHSNDGVRFHAIKFVETTILLFTPDPNSSSQPPSHQQDSDVRGFNVAWIVGGHPVLDAAALGEEASRNLGCLLDQLRPPDVSKLPGTVAIVLVNSLAAIAKKRPSMYGRVLPVLLSLGPTCETIKGPQAASVIHTLRNAFLAFLKCTHPVAGPWRERLLSALRAMNAGDVAESAFRQVEKTRRNAEKDRASRDNHLIKDDRAHGTASGLEIVRKRPSPQENGNQISDLDENTSKRVRDNSSATQPVTSIGQDANRLGETSSVGIASDTELSPLQQMIAMIGALVAKGERAAASIELLITSLPADMLADIVIENMKNLPVTPPPFPVVGATTAGPGVTVETNSAPSSTLATTSVAPVSTAVEASSVQTASDHRRDLRSRDPRRVDPRKTAIPVGISQTQVGTPITPPKNDELTAEVPLNNLMPSTVVKTEGLIVLSNKEASQEHEHEQSTYIPGIHELSSTEMKVEEVDDFVMASMNTSISAATGTTTIEGSVDNLPPTQSVGTILPGVSATPLAVIDNQAVVSSLSSMLVEVSSTSLPAVSVKLEPVSGVKISTPPFSRDNHLPYLSTGSFSASGIPSHGLPAIIPVMQLNEVQQDALYKDALMRILEGCNPIAASGGAELRIALLARMIAQSHEDDEILGTLQKYILADYQSHKGHELAIHILYQLYCDKMADVDTNETSIEDGYEKFLLSVAQGLRDNLLPSDKSLSRLLGEVPLLPEASLKFLELLCIPATGEKDSLDRSTGDRVTQGLSAVWSLILFRPPIRAACLNIALQCAVHELEEVRTKAIRLVANKLYPLEYASQTVEDFATRMLQSVIEARQNLDGTRESAEADTGYQEQTTEKESEKQKPSISDQNGAEGLGSAFRSVAEEDQRQSSRNTISATDAIRYMSLFFALCVKKNSLLRHLFAVFGRAPKGVKQAVKWQMPTLIRTIGPSVELLQIISDPPSGSKNLVLQVLHILTESTAPPVELINAVKQLHEKSKDAAVLIPVLSSLSKDEVLPIFPPLVDLSPDNFKAALARILQGSVNTGPALSPAEVLIAIHGIDAERDGVPLSKVKDACSICFQQRTVFTQQVLAKVLNQLVEQTPLPMLFMRTVIQAVGAFHSLVNFVMEILSRLVSKQIWKSPTLWVGFLKCADQTQPHSFHVLLQLPAAQLEKALHKHPNLRSPLTAHASQPNIRSTLPRSTLVVLGLAQDAPIDSVVPSQSGGDGSGPPSVPNDTVATESAPTV